MASILITGANGQLGNELRDLSKQFYGYDFTFTDVDSLDITNPGSTSEFIRNLRPDWMVNCAAYNLVDKAETEPETAMLINGSAVKNITEAISGTECRLIHVSTDYVYDGNSNLPYDENVIANPQSAYGRSKLAGEKYALLHPGSMIIRTAWLYSSYGNNFVKTMLRYGAERDSLRVVFDQTGTPTYAADLAGAIMSIISGVIRNHFAFKAGVYNYSNEGVCSWYDFAVEIIKEAGLTCQVNPVLSKDYQQAAKRPSYSVMDKNKIKENYNINIPHWRTSLLKCLKVIK
ncbi:MAG: dTDP-4-dehydrorhamnose reductase [Bacteroidetes bacterium GWE2_41_25]|nr:MAG: dTDP-4-dehydrorhamnose reductase [Bacteroidetes bacterium GWA2_40_15]OFX93670.1 MAG: dTDP-4-dehydrorhamnose reductase [Bacteroidetes bacterium GWC2_40_22]OFY01602.1 MAG: dTDP-4-dehydrorhamnose reductase [Bacteroidetes bacterium GWE2_41_25]OFY61104.1 MAG: dTDP-4-dehydrorhamnose reductase [Bacteroidetes bacterium GWF2_41_9]HAM08803.1 dTDP-4-dehydrorhamnose reductase [Bacteroidales bacterium]